LERDVCRDERDAARTERDTLQAEHDALRTEHDALQAEHDALTAERDALAAERDEATAAWEVAKAEVASARADAQAAADAAAVQHEAALLALDHRDRLAAAALAAAERLAADPAALREALGLVAPEAGAVRAALVVKTAAGPTVRAAWHAAGYAPLAEPGDLLDAGELDAWADARDVEHLAALPLPGGLVLLDAPAWAPSDEALSRAAFAPLAVALRHREDDAETLGRSRLLASVSHEVRTALTSILGYAEVLADETTAEARVMADSILGSGARLLHPLVSVLDIARLEGGGGTAALAPVDVGAVVEAAAAPFRARADARDLAFF